MLCRSCCIDPNTLSCPFSYRKRDSPGAVCAEGPAAVLAGELLSLHRLSDYSTLQQGGGVDHLQQTYLCVLQTGKKHIYAPQKQVANIALVVCNVILKDEVTCIFCFGISAAILRPAILKSQLNHFVT